MTARNAFERSAYDVVQRAAQSYLEEEIVPALVATMAEKREEHLAEGGRMKTCDYCGATGLAWHQNEDDSWSLLDGDAVHRCRPPQAKRNKPDDDGYIGEAKVRREMDLRKQLYGDGDG